MTELRAGKKAPDFSAPDQTGKLRTLSEFAGKKLILYFYPKDDTPGCTAEACNLRDNYERFQEEGYEILGVSPDSAKRHLKFIHKHTLPFDLLVDEDHAVARAYGVWGEKKFMGRTFDGIHRTTFVIDEFGRLADVILKVKTKDHTTQLLEAE